MTLSFKGKTAFITGAGSGIGRALAETLAAEGCNLAISDKNEAALEETAALVRSNHIQVRTTVLDVADREAVQAEAEAVLTHFGGVDLVINNAGVALSDTVAEMSYDDLEWMMNINFWGVVHGTKAFLPAMKARNMGHIVNVSSVFGLFGVPAQSAYCAAKFAVRGFTESLRLEMLGSGVTVHSVHPGGVATNIANNSRFRRNAVGETDVEEARKGSAQMLTLPPSDAARIILDGVRKGDPKILVGRDAKIMDLVQRLRPRGFGPWLMRRFQRARATAR
jgi:short-subunit dehydrogenase